MDPTTKTISIRIHAISSTNSDDVVGRDETTTLPAGVARDIDCDCCDLLLQPLNACTSRQEQLHELVRLTRTLETTFNSSTHSNGLYHSPEIKRKVAAFLIQQVVVVVVVGDVETNKALYDALYRGCGPLASLCAAVETIQQLGTTTTTTPTTTPTFASPSNALTVALAVIQTVLFKNIQRQYRRRRVAQDDNDDGDNDAVAESCRHSRWLDELFLEREGEKRPDSSSSTMSILEPWIQLLLLLPITIANACHATTTTTNNHNTRSLLPRWCTAFRFHVQLVECACRNALGALENDHDNNHNNHNNHSNCFVVFFTQLVQRMLRRRGCGDEVALGLYNGCRRVNNDDNNNLLLESFFKKSLSTLPPRELALLCSALVKHALSLTINNNNNNINNNDASGGGGDDDDHADETITTAVHPWLDRSCVPLLATSRRVQDAFVNLTILSSSSSSSTLDARLPHVVASLLFRIQSANNNGNGSNIEDGDEDDADSDDDDNDDVNESSNNFTAVSGVLWRQVALVTATWSQPVFVQQANYQTQRHVSNFIQSGLSLLLVQHQQQSKKEQEDIVTSSLVANLLEGVTERLHTTNVDSVRKDGMRVGERLGKLLGQEVTFDELQVERNNNKLKKQMKKNKQSPVLVVSPTAGAEMTTTKGKRRKQRRQKQQRTKQVDPDAEYRSDDDDDQADTSSGDEDNGSTSSSKDMHQYDDDSVWDEDSIAEEVLDPYDLHDDEDDLRETPLPLYLLDCLDLLRAPETEDSAYSKHEAALEALPGLVSSSQPGNLSDVAASLATQLLRMENKFNVDRFGEKIHQSLCALTVQEPILVGQTLIAEFFQDGSLTNRLDVLSTLMEAAHELSGNKMLEDSVKAKPRLGPMDGPSVYGKRSLVSSASHSPETLTLMGDPSLVAASKTRRWGQSRKRPEQVTISNRLVPVAPVWFYSLIGFFWKQKDESSLWGGHLGSTLLARFFITLSVIVENCAPHPSTEILGKDLFDLVWSFRDAEISEVRASVLYTVGTSLRLLRTESLLPLLCNDSVDMNLALYLQETAASDPDDNCRSLAHGISLSVASSVRSIEM